MSGVVSIWRLYGYRTGEEFQHGRLSGEWEFSPSSPERIKPLGWGLACPFPLVLLITERSLHNQSRNPCCWENVLTPILQLWKQTQGCKDICIRPQGRQEAEPQLTRSWLEPTRPAVLLLHQQRLRPPATRQIQNRTSVRMPTSLTLLCSPRSFLCQK